MKKINYFYSLLIMALFLLPWSGVKATTPFTEGFETSVPPTGWSTIHVKGSTWTRVASDYYMTVHGGSYHAKISYSSSGGDNYLITPQLSPVVGETLKFYLGSTTWGGSTLTVEVSETGNSNASDFTTVLATYKSNIDINTTWGDAKEISLSDYAGKNIYIAFHMVDNNGDNVYIDDLSIEAPETCPKTSTPEASGIGATTATISWTAGGSETVWNLRYKKASDSEWTEVNGLTSTSYNLTELTAGKTTYNYEVQADCGGGDKSEWKAGTPFMTECGAITIDSKGWSEGFEGYTSGYSTGCTPGCFELIGANTGSAYTYPVVYVNTSSDFVKSGTKSLYLASSDTKDCYIIFPEFSQALNTLQIAFSHKGEQGGYPKTVKSSKLTLGYITDINDVSTFVALRGEFERSASWVEEEESLAGVPAGVANTARLAIKVGASEQSNYYTGIDDITISAAASCTKPSGLAVGSILPDGATFSWDEGGASAWQYIVVEKNAAEDWTNPNDVNTNAATISGLAADTEYDFYLRTNCGGAQSNSVKVSFTPVCPAPTGVTISSIGTTTATASWTAADNITDYQYCVVEAGEAATWDKSTTETSVDLTGLNPSTSYDFYVRSYKSATSYKAASKVNFRTACAAIVDALAWTEGFEDYSLSSTPDCWVLLNCNTGYKPIVNVNSTYKHNGNNSLYLNAYSDEGYGYVILPEFSVSLNALQIKFWHIEQSATCNLSFGYMTDVTNASSYVELKACTASTAWSEEEVSLSGLLTNARLAFRYVGSPDSYSKTYAAIDDISFATPPTCVKPVLGEATDITPEGATFAWTAGSDETQYDYCVVASGEAADGWITLDENVRTVTITGKTAGTTYDFYVRSNCGGVNGVSEAVKGSFTPVIDAPTAVTITAISNNGATASWSAAANITTYQYCLVEAGEAATWDQNIDDVTVALSGLNANTEYDFYVRSFYAATSAVAAAEKVTFTTLCDPITVSTEAYEEHFDAFPACWDNKEGTTTNPSYRWSSYSGGKEGYGLRFDSYDNSYKTNILASPVFVLNADADLTFWAKNPKGGDYKVQIAVDGGARADLLTGMTNITAWTKKEASLAAYQGHSIQFFFCATSNDGSGDAYLYLDELAITPQSCRKPATLNEATALTSDGATFTWTAGGTATDYQYAVVEAGQTPVWDPANVVSALTVTVNGLESSTSYDFYVRTYCDELNQSEPRQVTFKTTCGVYTGSYEESFTNTLPDCWTATEAAYTWAPYNQTGSNYCVRFDSYMNSDGNQAALTTAQFKLDEDVALKFLCKNKDGGPFKVDMYVVEDAATIELFGDLTGIANWEEKTYSLSDYAGKTVYFTFHGTSNEAPYSTGVDAYMYIDDFRLVRNLSLADNTDNTSLLAANTGKTLDVQINRTFVCADYYNTLCLPFDLPTLDGTPFAGGELWAFKYATVDQTSDELLFRIIEAESIEAGVPYLIAWPAGESIVNPTFKNVTISATTGQNIGDASVAQLCGIIEKPVVFTAHDETKLFLAENNTLYWWNGDADSQLNNFRAYFLVNTNSGANNAPRHGMRARIIKEEQVITGVEEITNDELRMTNKILRNGQLLIIHNGNIINVLGQPVR